MTSVIKLQKKGQLTIPTQMRTLIGLSEGDYVQMVARGHQIILEPAQVWTRTAAAELTPKQKRALDARLAKSMADVKAGRVHGPFDSAAEASLYVEKYAKQRPALKANRRGK